MLPENLPEVFLDTDIAFDIISKREPHFTTSILILQLAAEGKIRLSISESCLANLFYLSFDIYKLEDAASKLSDFISACQLMPSGKQIALWALESAFKDKEDALQYFTAVYTNSQYFITRNVKDYKPKSATIPICTPTQFIKIFDTKE